MAGLVSIGANLRFDAAAVASLSPQRGEKEHAAANGENSAPP
jgi:hypothetical protein